MHDNYKEGRVVKSALHEHWRTSSHLTEKDVRAGIYTAYERLGDGGVVGLVNFNPSSTEIDPRWELFEKHLASLQHHDKMPTGNGYHVRYLEKDLLVVKGQEVPTKEGHVLLIGTPKDFNVGNGSSLDAVITKVQASSKRVLLFADHPCYKSGIRGFLEKHSDYLQYFDGIEVFNGISTGIHGPKDANARAQKYFHSQKTFNDSLVALVGSDGHSIYEIGRSHQNIRMPLDYSRFHDNPEEVNKALKLGLQANRAENLGDVRHLSRIGELDHTIDLSIIIAARKFLNWDSNKKTAPYLEGFGISI